MHWELHLCIVYSLLFLWTKNNNNTALKTNTSFTNLYERGKKCNDSRNEFFAACSCMQLHTIYELLQFFFSILFRPVYQKVSKLFTFHEVAILHVDKKMERKRKYNATADKMNIQEKTMAMPFMVTKTFPTILNYVLFHLSIRNDRKRS